MLNSRPMTAYTWRGPVKTEPDFSNLANVLQRKRPDRPTLFEFFLNESLYELCAGPEFDRSWNDRHPFRWEARIIHAFRNAGYDYAIVPFPPSCVFPYGEIHQASSKSLNEGAVITDRAAFESYAWPVLRPEEYEKYHILAQELVGGMKFAAYGPSGVLENLIALVGYDQLCYLLADEPDLVREIVDKIGASLLAHYELAAQYESVGLIIINDDMGYKTQTMISPTQLRSYILPWHKRMAESAHKAGKLVALHACGQLKAIMDDIITMGIDGKHSYEDVITPVEDAYELYGSRIAILGGIDMDFLCRAEPEAIYRRSCAMLERAENRGGYALGSGNSIAHYVPTENYFAMTAAALKQRR